MTPNLARLAGDRHKTWDFFPLFLKKCGQSYCQGAKDAIK